LSSPGHFEVLRFDEFEFNLTSGELRKRGKVLRLQPQPAKVLSLLALQAGKLVTRDELKQQVWHDTTFVNFQDGLNFCIRSIRAVLHDKAAAPHFIETLPRRGYRFIAPVEHSMAEDSEKLDSVAVLPLENLSNDPDEDYFTDGMTDELTTELAKIHGLRVISRTSVRIYKSSRKSLPEIASRLNVSTIVEGTVVRFGNRVRIAIQLIRARKEEQLWAQSFERDLGDILKLQGELASTIAAQIHIRLSAQDRLRFGSARHIDPAAHEAYLRGRYFCNKRTEETLKKAREYFEQAIAKEPAHAPAYSGLADTYFYCGYYFGKAAPAAAMPEAKAAALTALALDNTLAEAHTSLALVKFFFEWDFAAAEQQFNTAIAFNPNYATAYQAHSVLLGAMRCHRESIAEATKALEVDPLSIPVNNIVGEMFSAARQWTQAIDQYRKTIELDPNVALVHENLGTALEESGRLDESIEEYLVARKLSAEDDFVVRDLRLAYEKHGMRGYRAKQLELALERWSGWHVDAFQIASLYARLDDPTSAMAWLEKAVDARSGMLIWLIMYPDFTNILPHPEFRRLVQDVGLPLSPTFE
jgi:TolB-like protein/Tfp pilus assembly protein PilF